MLNFLLDWFSQEESDDIILKIAQLIQVTGGHSISGKDIRKIFALLRSEKVGNRQQYCSLLMNSISSMLNEKGPTAFFDLIGNDSVSILNSNLCYACFLLLCFRTIYPQKRRRKRTRTVWVAYIVVLVWHYTDVLHFLWLSKYLAYAGTHVTLVINSTNMEIAPTFLNILLSEIFPTICKF